MRAAPETADARRGVLAPAAGLSPAGAINETGGREMRWSDILGARLYEISDTGLVRTKAPSKRWPAGHVIAVGYRTRGGYARVILKADNGKKKEFVLHRVLMRTFGPPKPSSKHIVAHFDGNPKNYALSNLRWATPAENEADKILHGRARLTVDEHVVRALRSEFEPNKRGSVAGLARRFAIPHPTVWNIVHGRSYRHVTTS